MKKRTKGIWLGIALIIVAVLLILNSVGASLGLIAGIPVTAILLSAVCLAWAVSALIRGEGYVFFPLAFIFMIFEKQIAGWVGASDPNLISNWLVLLCALLLCIGTYSLRGGGHKCHCHIKAHDEGTVSHSHGEENNFSKRMGSSSLYIDCTTFKVQNLDLNMGSCEVFFENPENYAGDGVLMLDINMSSVTINVPSSWSIVNNIETSLAHSEIPCGAPNGKVLYINGDNNLGSVEVVLV